MTEFTTSPIVYEEYLTARERCARWVQSHSSDRDGFYSPSVPPTELEGFIPPCPPSDTGSSHSLPPNMVLRYNDGRPDIPIPPHTNPSLRRHERDPRGPPTGPPYQPSFQRSPTNLPYPHPASSIPIHSSHKSTRSHASRHPHPEPIGANAGSPEEIRVLPSQGPAPSPLPPRSAATSSSHRQRSHHSRSKSLPRTDPNLFPEEDAPAPGSPSRPIAYPPPPNHSNAAPQINPQAGPMPWHGLHTHSSSSSTKYSSGHSSHKVPPAIVYAPHHGHAPHYTPPAILYHPPPPRGPNGMIYSHSAPVPIQGGCYPAPMPPGNYEHRGRRDRLQPLGPGKVHKVPRSDDGRGSDAESVGSESTYYVLPAPGQKVHVIAPSPGQSIHTATSTTKSPGQSPKKPFFRRLFNFAKIGSSTGGPTQGPRNKLQRRHSTGDSGRPTFD